MQLQDAIRDYLATQLCKISDLYNWNFTLTGFPDNNYEQTGLNAYEKSRNLRSMINNEINNRSPISNDLQIWYVKNWGGVKSNKNETMLTYMNANVDQLISLGSKGIATWSKILSIRNPSEYAIYDARVAVSLNSIQKIYDVESPILFPQLASRNKSFVLPTQQIINNSRFFKNKCDMNFYLKYLDILSYATSKTNGFDIQDAEMVLFSNAEELSTTWR